MSNIAINKFINASELYLRLTEKDRSELNIDKIDRQIYSECVPISESIEFSNLGNLVEINNTYVK